MDYSEFVFVAIVFLVLLAGWAFVWLGRRERLRSLEALAARHKLQPMDWELFDFPASLLEDRLGLNNPYNAIGGYSGDDFLLAFDVQAPALNKNPDRRTVVARRYGAPIPPRGRVPRGVIVVEEGQWRALTPRRSYFTSGLMHPDEIERAWKFLA